MQLKTRTADIYSFANTTTNFGRHQFFLRENTITKASLFTHDQFLDKLYNEVNVIWLTYLRCALEIYRGNLCGFCDISDEPTAR